MGDGVCEIFDVKNIQDLLYTNNETLGHEDFTRLTTMYEFSLHNERRKKKENHSQLQILATEILIKTSV